MGPPTKGQGFRCQVSGVSSATGDQLPNPAKRFLVSAGFILYEGDGKKLIFSLTKQFLIGNEPVYQNCQKQVKPVAM